LEQLLQPLFYGSDQDVMATVYDWNEGDIFTVILWVSGLIAGVLAYVSWRKFLRNEEVTV
jgi:hypothetical protein